MWVLGPISKGLRKKNSKAVLLLENEKKKNRVGKLQILAAGRRKGWGREGKASLLVELKKADMFKPVGQEAAE